MDFYRYYKSRQGEMLNFLKELVNLESPSQDKKAVDKCSSFIVNEFKKTGAKATRLRQKEVGDLYHVEYPFVSTKERKEQLLILLHCDTVWPVGTLDKRPFYVSGNKVYGPGVLDMKAGIVMAVFCLRTLNKLNIQLEKKIAIFINSAEEIGYKASYEVIQSLARKSNSVLCLEPALPGGALKTQRKGRMVISLKTKGKAAHAGTPHKGTNAIEELTLQIYRLRKLRTKETTLNIGLISGGQKANIVPEEASVTLDIRFWKNTDKEKITNYFKQINPILPGAKIRYAIESVTPPMEKTNSSTALLDQVKEIAATLGLSLKTGKAGGGSDASIASNMGVATLDGLGPDGDGIHAQNEHLLISSLVERTALLTEILSQL